jgi:hypothetical protein
MSKASALPSRNFTAADVGDLLLDGHRIAHVRELLAENGIAMGMMGALKRPLSRAEIDEQAEALQMYADASAPDFDP